MKSLLNSLCIFGCAFGIMATGSAVAQTEQWQHHTTTNNSHSSADQTAYYKTPALKPAKKNIKNPLRHQGWHTTPDPYIEEGGVYTKKPHPALTQKGHSLHNLSSGTPNSFSGPPSSVSNPYRNGSKQQAVQIQNPAPGNIAPIPLPPVKP